MLHSEGSSLTHLLYLHGFRSSPKSAKARTMAQLFAARHPEVTWWCPQLPPEPALAMGLLYEYIAGWPVTGMVVVGSSLGGFYATHVAERLGCKAVLLNPAVDPARDLQRYVGGHTQWHDPHEAFEFKASYVDQLKALKVPAVTRPHRYYTVIAKGDEVLDWREMTARYQGSPGQLQEGGDHALSNFDEHLPGILAFLGLPV